MKHHLPDFHVAGSGLHFHRVAAIHHPHSNHYFDAIIHSSHLPHPLHWAHIVAHDLYSLHPIHRIHLLAHKLYRSHAAPWVADHTLLIAMLLTAAIGYALYLLISAIQINDYSSGGVWALFG